MVRTIEDVEFPSMRIELIRHLQTLSSPDYQRLAWIDHCYPLGIEYDEFNLTIHFFYDDTLLSEDPDLCIGTILKSKEESDSIKRVVREMEVLFDRYGLNLEDGEYMNKPEWKNIVTKAKDACLIFGVLPSKLE